MGVLWKKNYPPVRGFYLNLKPKGLEVLRSSDETGPGCLYTLVLGFADGLGFWVFGFRALVSGFGVLGLGFRHKAGFYIQFGWSVLSFHRGAASPHNT